MNNRKTYVENFEVMLEILLFITCSGKAATWQDIHDNVIDKHRATLNRYLKALAELGFLTRCERTKNGIFSYVASSKAKELFGVKG